MIDDAQLFLPLTAPVRWSLVSARIQGFAGNRYARSHAHRPGARSPAPETEPNGDCR